MNIKIKCNIIMLSLLVFAGAAAGEPQKSFLSIQDILSGWQSNYGSLKSMKVSYSQNNITIEPSQGDPNFNKSMVKRSCVEITEADGKFRSRNSAAENGFDDINSIEEMSFDGIHQRIFSVARKSGSIYAGLYIYTSGTLNILKRYFLLDPSIDQMGRVKNAEPEFSRYINEALADPNLTISVRPYLEEMAGQMCHVIDIEFFKKDRTKGRMTVIWVAHEKGMLPMKTQEFNGDTDAISLERTIEQIDFAKTENGGLWYPKKAYTLMNLPRSIGVIKVEFNVTEFIPNITVDPNVFNLDFPNGTQVGDADLKINYTVGVKKETTE